MENYIKEKKGFTLIEILVVATILSLIVGFLGYLSVRHFWVYNNQISELNVEGDTRGALDDIDNYVRSAYRVASNYQSYSTDQDTLILQIPSIDALNRVIDDSYDTVVFSLSNSSLVREIFPDPSSSRVSSTKTITGNSSVDALTFSYDNGNYALVKQITILVTVSQKNGSYERSITISSKSSLRNYE